jgi:hypothetical protein
MSKDHLLEIQITQPGRITGQYHPVTIDALRLEKIIQPVECLPFDIGILPTALNPFNEPLGVLILGSLSHPINTEMEAKLLGAVQRMDETPFLLAAPVADESAPQSLEDIPPRLREEMDAVLRKGYPGEWRWLTAEEVEPLLHAAVLRYRSRKAQDKLPQLDPAWQPLHLDRPAPSFAEAERYTPAEYTFFELPHRFQQYVGEALAPDERVLYAARRPAMSSQRNRSFLRRERLQEGVLILTSQRLIHLTELLPPDSANVRYGFHTVIGLVERLADISVSALGNDSLLLSTVWNAHGGNTIIEWEMPRAMSASLRELTAQLERFKANDAAACQLRRASTPPPPDPLPPLNDPASTDPQSGLPLNERFSNALAASLRPAETVHAWALLPEWFDPKCGAQALVVTDRRLFLLPDLGWDISLQQAATLEFTSSILESSLVINYIEGAAAKRKVILFPYPAQHAFRECLEAARRCMAVVPLSYAVK